MKSQSIERIFLIGLPGAGKTTTGRALAGWLRWSFLDLDDLITAQAGKSVAAIFADAGEARFRALESSALAEACERKRLVIATGGGIGETPGNLALMRETGNIICLDVEPAMSLARLSAEATTHGGSLPDARPLLTGADPLARLSELRTRRQRWYSEADLTLDANAVDPGELAQNIVARLAGLGALPPNDATPISRMIATTTGGSYESIIGWGAIATLAERLNRLNAPRRIFIITDSIIAPLYQETAELTLAQAGFATETCVIPAGEVHKTLDQWRAVLDWLVERRAERGEFLLALGGGVVGDLAGFAAASYLRGVPLVHIPTSLLAQVDSSIGGKVGVDLPQGKNLVGAFYPPRLVLADPALLLTLPRRQFVEGWAEVIKLGVALDDDYFAFLEANADALLRLEPELLCATIARAVAIKAEVVERDEGEQGERALLNYGHTLGHAIEQVTGYERWLHGEAVSIGMAFAARLGYRIGVTPAELIDRQDALLERTGLPIRADGLPLDRLYDAMARDKKARDGAMRWVIPTALGRSALIALPTEDVRAALLEFGATDAPASDGPQTIGAADAQ
ncbi:MAG TPA: 3-dehydroquinate synthase [Ktedonobacterales bacterium]|jgi:3-dehydroquinate synthase